MPRSLFAIALLSAALSTGSAALAQTEEEWAKRDLASAARACDERDKRAFFDIFLQSEVVRQKYTAAELTVITTRPEGTETTRIPGKDYTDFPLAIMDYYYVSALRKDKDGYAHIKHEINQSSDNRLRVDWVSVYYDGNSEGGDDPGKEIGIGKDPGILLFYPTDNCWELIQVEVTLPPG